MIFDAALEVKCALEQEWKKASLKSATYKGITFTLNTNGVYEAPNLPADLIAVALETEFIVLTIQSSSGEGGPDGPDLVTVE